MVGVGPNLGEPEPWRARADEDGQFVFETLPPGPVVMRAEVPGHQHARGGNLYAPSRASLLVSLRRGPLTTTTFTQFVELSDARAATSWP